MFRLLITFLTRHINIHMVYLVVVNNNTVYIATTSNNGKVRSLYGTCVRCLHNGLKAKNVHTDVDNII
jgi:hypothetical protein